MSSTIPIINLIPVPVTAPIAEIIPNELDPPTNVSADFSVSSKKMKVSATISIPSDVDPSSVVLFQYLDPNNLLQLQFYFVYDITGNTVFTQYNCPFDASNVDGNGRPIKLSKITTISTMLKDADPKTSRGTVASVRSIGGSIDVGVPKK